MLIQRFNLRILSQFKISFTIVLVASLVLTTVVYASHATGGTDVKITNDNNNVDGGTPNPGFDAQNRQSNETTVAISPANPSIITSGSNDYRMVTVDNNASL
ncbi:MAG TPA: hypothetical protein VN843_26240 [Anaerolineales bacterium]|nr:hypothetical protein [Anaerolineales bacterium]